MTDRERSWWRQAVVYQIYTRSFQDSDGDGIGDFGGIIQRLDDLKDLGVDVLWLSPFCLSPNDDNGYDISDYYQVQPEFGGMEALEELIAKAGERGMRIMMDLVFNHTSDEHPWFLESRSSRDNPRRNWYLWAPPKPDGALPNNWDSFFEGKAWEWDPTTGEYYCHLFSRKQPDLNWANPQVRQELKKIAWFWIEKGIAAFRLDAIHLIGKPTDLADAPAKVGHPFRVWENRPETHQYLKEFHREVFGPAKVFTVGETGGNTPRTALKYVRGSRQELDCVFHFDHHHLRDPRNLHAVLEDWQRWHRVLRWGGWDAPFLSNHDLARQVSVFGDEGLWRSRSAQLLAAVLLTAWGTPFVYQGEEYGLTNSYFPDRSYYRDRHAARLVDALSKLGSLPDEVWNAFRQHTRDNARVPISWDGTEKAGFTTGEPWMPLSPRRREINAASDRGAEDSVFCFYRELIRLRKSRPVFIQGTYRVLSRGGPLGVVERRLGKERALVLLNMSSRTQILDCRSLRFDGSVSLVLGNYVEASEGRRVEHPFYKPRARLGSALGTKEWLRPWEVRIYLRSLRR